MTVDIADLLVAPEGKTLEFKRELSSLKQIMKTVVAFANTAGGTLIVGREDDGSVVGVEDPLLAEEKLSNAIADSIMPLIMPDIEIVSLKPDVRQQVLPDARVSCARFSGSSKADFIDRLDLEGSIIEVIEQVPVFIRRNTRLYPKIAGMRREDIPAYPVAAVREILVNAVTHCDYSLAGMRVMIAIFNDRMEIQSPGTLPLGMTIDDFKAGLSRIRNRVIARVFRELGLMEEWGSGYRRVTDSCTRAGYPVPEWQEVGPSLRVTIFPHPEAGEQLIDVPVNVPVNERQTWFMEQLHSGNNCKASDLAAQWQVTEKTAKRDIADLKKKGLVRFAGPSKIGRYVLAG